MELPRAPVSAHEPTRAGSGAQLAPAPGMEASRSTTAERPARHAGRLATLTATVLLEGRRITPVGLTLRRGATPLAAAGIETALGTRFGGLDPGRYSLEVEPASLPPGLLALPDPATGSPERSVHVGPGEQRALELALVAAARVDGSVRDAHGRPVPEAEVHLEPIDPLSGLVAHAAHSDERGEFELLLVLPGAYRFGTRWPAGRWSGAAPPPIRLTLAAGEARRLEPCAEPTARTIRGQLLDEAGRACAGVRVRCEWDEGEHGPRPRGEPVVPSSLVVARTRSEPDGSFRLTGLPAGPLRLRVAPRLGGTPFARPASAGPGFEELVVSVDPAADEEHALAIRVKREPRRRGGRMRKKTGRRRRGRTRATRPHLSPPTPLPPLRALRGFAPLRVAYSWRGKASTGTRAWRMTASATLPITKRRKPVRPWVESAIASQPCCTA